MVRVIFPTGIAVTYEKADKVERDEHNKCYNVCYEEEGKTLIVARVPMATNCIIDYGLGEFELDRSIT